MNEISPCKDCTERHTACHGSCEKYKEWHERYQAQQKHLADSKSSWQIPWSSARERTHRTYLKFGASSHTKGGS